ncbi:MAG: sensor histidine kinase [Pegethrix bostrychoides GSE-TBD4-15B]|uniref:histidine kinase n=1 Tax=Pegethrix bostrychoides GSE-TBD4-15B TaxID=2839662 RepID=A0A951P7J4_9CYAN|nr:sensor histidine kinase [Pegethrix bostrychoides GSE-TBD4-15B]
MPAPSRPFRLLLYLEWLLLGMALVTAVMPVPLQPFIQFSALELLCTVGLGMMGLRLPSQTLSKILYTALEFGLMLLPILVTGQNRTIPILVMLIAIRSSQMFKPLGQLIVVCLAFTLAVLFFNKSGPMDQFMTSVLNSVRDTNTPQSLSSENTILLLKFHGGLSFGLVLTSVMLLVNHLLAERQSRKDLATAHEQLQRYAAQIENQATLQERNRIAREIHDALGHTLTAQSIQLENALLFCPAEAEKTQMFLTQAKQLCSKSLQEVRQSVSTLRSRSTKGQTLEQAITTAVQEFQQSSAVQLDYLFDLNAAVPAEVSIVVCRIIQEALVNTYKHSSATRVKVQLRSIDRELILVVADNGCGFDPSLNRTGFGLQGIRERTMALGGQFTLIAQPNHGCYITVSIPLPDLLPG